MNRLRLLTILVIIFFLGSLSLRGVQGLHAAAVHANAGEFDSSAAPPASRPTPVPTPSPRPRQKRRPYNREEHPPEKSPSSREASDDRFNCISPEINLDEAVLVETTKSAGSMIAKTETVRDRLVKLQARCVQGKLTGARRKQIYIHRLIGCWGNPPEDYLEQLNRQAADIEQLKKKYILIQIPCGGNVDPRLIN
jgi:hypothetical protein